MQPIEVAWRRLRGAPKRVKRRFLHAADYIVRVHKAAFRDHNIIKVILRIPGARIDPGFDPSRVKEYPPVGRCIYCGKTEPEVKLTLEHIMAASLGGEAGLPKASCIPCAKITRGFEEYCARTIFRDVRVRFDIPRVKRRPEEWLQTLPIYPTRDPTVSMPPPLEVPPAEHPSFMLMPIMGRPGIVDGRPPSEEVRCNWWVRDLAPDREERSRSLESRFGGAVAKVDFRHRDFLQLLYKTAYCLSVAEYGAKSIAPLGVEYLMKGTSLPYLVGGTDDPFSAPVGGLHWVRPEIRRVDGRRFVVVFIRLFDFLSSPTYSVVVGEYIKPEWLLSRVWDRLVRPLRNIYSRFYLSQTSSPKRED